MQRRSAVSSQLPSVMPLLGSNKITTDYIVSQVDAIASSYGQPASLSQITEAKLKEIKFSATTAVHYFDFAEVERWNDSFIIMQFFNKAAHQGLLLPFTATDEEGKVKRAFTIKSAYIALLFGAGNLANVLLEQDQAGVIELTDKEIQQLVQIQLSWYEKAFGQYNAETNRHDTTNIDARLQEHQALPDLLTNKKVWDAVRKNEALYKDLKRVVFHSGRAIQVLLDADQRGTVVNLNNAERRELVQKQITQYFAAKSSDVTIKVEDQQTPSFKKPSKVWDALMEGRKESWTFLLKFLKDLDVELPEHFRIANPNALFNFTENNPMAYKAYFESEKAKALLSTQNIDDPKIRNYIETRNSVMKALFELRHAVFNPENKALLGLDPAILAQERTNKREDDLAATAIRNKKAEVNRAKEAIDQRIDTNIREVNNREIQDTKSFKVEYVGRKGFYNGSTISEYYSKQLAKLKAARESNNTADIAVYEARIDQDFPKQPAFQDYLSRKESRETEKTNLNDRRKNDKEMQDNILADFEATKETEKTGRIETLDNMKCLRQTKNVQVVEDNALTISFELLFLSAIQDWAMFGTFTQDIWQALGNLLSEDFDVINAGLFSLAYSSESSKASDKLVGKIPAHMFNHPVYMAMFDIYRRDPQNFRKNIQSQLFNFDGSVIPADYAKEVDLKAEKKEAVKSLRTAFPLSLDITKNTPADANKAIADYNIEGYISPLSEYFKSSSLLMRLMLIQQISPQHNLSHVEFFRDAAFLRACLNKAIIGRAPSPSVDNDKMLLVALQDPQALRSLLLKDNQNPFYNILVRHGLMNVGDFSFMETKEFIQLEVSINQLANNPESTAPENVENRYKLITFLKGLVGLETELKNAPKNADSGDSKFIEEEVAQDLRTRKSDGKETEVDVILIEVFNNYSVAMRTDGVLKNQKVGNSVGKTAWLHDMQAKASRASRAGNGVGSASDVSSPVAKPRSGSVVSPIDSPKASSVAPSSSSSQSVSPAPAAVVSSAAARKPATPPPLPGVKSEVPVASAPAVKPVPVAMFTPPTEASITTVVTRPVTPPAVAAVESPRPSAPPLRNGNVPLPPPPPGAKPAPVVLKAESKSPTASEGSVNPPEVPVVSAAVAPPRPAEPPKPPAPPRNDNVPPPPPPVHVVSEAKSESPTASESSLTSPLASRPLPTTPKPSFFADILALKKSSEENAEGARPFSTRVRELNAEHKASAPPVISPVEQKRLERRGSIAEVEVAQIDHTERAGEDDEFRLENGKIIGTNRFDEDNPEEYCSRMTPVSLNIAGRYFKEQRDVEGLSFVEEKLAAFSPK